MKHRSPGPGQMHLLPEIGQVVPRPPVKRRQPPARIPTHSTRAQVAPRPQPRPHGPTRTRQQPGELHGAAPTSRQVRHVPLMVEQLDDGKWRFTMPRAPGAGWVAGRPPEVIQAIRAAFTEAQVAAYSDWRGHAYDASVPSYKRHKPKARSRKRCDVYEASEWRRDPDSPNIWISPKGLRYPEERQVVKRVIAQLARQGKPVPAVEQPPASVTSMTARRVHTTSQQPRRGKTA